MINAAMIVGNKDEYSETFIRAHENLLPLDILPIYSLNMNYQPKYYGKNQIIIFHKPLFLILDYIKYRDQRLSFKELQDKGIARFLRSKNIHVVLAEYGTWGIGVMEACKIAKIPLVVYFRGYDIYNQEILNKVGNLYPKLFKLSTAIIGVSKPIIEILKSLGAPNSKLHYIPSGVDVSQFNFAAPQRLHLFLSVGRFVDKKAPDLTLLAFKKALVQEPQARLIKIGEGGLFQVCHRLAKVTGLAAQTNIERQFSMDQCIRVLMRVIELVI